MMRTDRSADNLAVESGYIQKFATFEILLAFHYQANMIGDRVVLVFELIAIYSNLDERFVSWNGDSQLGKVPAGNLIQFESLQRRIATNNVRGAQFVALRVYKV